MLDRRLLREDPERIANAVKNRRGDVDIDGLIAIDKEMRAAQQEADELKHTRNTTTEEIAKKKKAGENADDLLSDMKALSQRIKDIEQKEKDLTAKLDEGMMVIPNVPHDSVPVGATEEDNVTVRTWGEPGEAFDGIKPHWEIGETLGVLDLEAGRRVSGRGFIVFRGLGARLCRGLINMFLDKHLEQGYEEVGIPFAVNREAMTGTGQLPKFEEDMYHMPVDDLFLIPTSEVPVTNIVREQFIPRDELPMKMTAYSPCFRREAGSHGADTRGLLRVHQFDKVEMVKIVYPDTSYDELETLVTDATCLLEDLELPYRVLELNTSDLGFAAAKCYDLEVYAPAVDKWLEVSSCSNFEDFQARRAGIKIKKEKGEKYRFCHTLNGSGLALPRIIATIMEHHQTPTGRVKIPEKLRAYMGGLEYLG